MSEIIEPNIKHVRKATMKAFKGKLKDEDINHFLETLSSEKAPGPLQASASLAMALIFGVVHCEPKGQPWEFTENVWGVGAAGITSIGLMYTTLPSWDAFFRETTAFHVQGYSEGGGLFQINWFRSDGLPTGQFNGLAGGIAAFEAGGSGHWKRK